MKKTVTSFLALTVGLLGPTPSIPQEAGRDVIFPPTPVPSLTSIRLETIRSRDEELLRTLAVALQARHGELLEGTEVLFTRVETHGTIFYRMDIQGIEDEARARRICQILEMEQCLVARPGASVLSGEVQGLSIAPDGLIDMSGMAQNYGRQTSRSLEMEPLPVQTGARPELSLPPVTDRLGQLPAMRPQGAPVPDVAVADSVVSEEAVSADDVAVLDTTVEDTQSETEAGTAASAAASPLGFENVSEFAPTVSLVPRARPGSVGQAASEDTAVSETVDAVEEIVPEGEAEVVEPLADEPVAPPVSSQEAVAPVVPALSGDGSVMQGETPAVMEEMPASDGSVAGEQTPEGALPFPMPSGAAQEAPVVTPPGDFDPAVLLPEGLEDQSGALDTIDDILAAPRQNNQPQLTLVEETWENRPVTQGMSLGLRNQNTQQDVDAPLRDEAALQELITRTLRREEERRMIAGRPVLGPQTPEVAPVGGTARVSDASGVVRSGPEAEVAARAQGEAVSEGLVFPAPLVVNRDAAAVAAGEAQSDVAGDFVQPQTGEPLLRLPGARPAPVAGLAMAQARDAQAVAGSTQAQTVAENRGEAIASAAADQTDAVAAAPADRAVGTLAGDVAPDEVVVIAGEETPERVMVFRAPTPDLEALVTRPGELAQLPVARPAPRAATTPDRRLAMIRETLEARRAEAERRESVSAPAASSVAGQDLAGVVSDSAAPLETQDRATSGRVLVDRALPDVPAMEDPVVVLTASENTVRPVARPATLMAGFPDYVPTPAQEEIVVASQEEEEIEETGVVVSLSAQDVSLISGDRVARAAGVLAEQSPADAPGYVELLALQQGDNAEPAAVMPPLPAMRPAVRRMEEAPALAFVLPQPRTDAAAFSMPELAMESMVATPARLASSTALTPVVAPDMTASVGPEVLTEVASAMEAPVGVQDTAATFAVSERMNAIAEENRVTMAAPGLPVPVLPGAVMRPEPPNRAFFNRSFPVEGAAVLASQDVTDAFMAALEAENMPVVEAASDITPPAVAEESTPEGVVVRIADTDTVRPVARPAPPAAMLAALAAPEAALEEAAQVRDDALSLALATLTESVEPSTAADVVEETATVLPRMRPTPPSAQTVMVAEQAPSVSQDTQERVATALIEAPRFGFVSDSRRFRPDVARVVDRPVDDFLAVFDTVVPLSAQELNGAGTITQVGPVTVAQSAAPAMATLVAFNTGWQVEATRPEDVLTLDEFIAALATDAVDFVVPTVLNLDMYEPSGSEFAELGLENTVDPGIVHAMRMQEQGGYPETILARMEADEIIMETPTRRVVIPRQAKPISRFAVALNDTYALPFDLSGSGRLPLQRMPVTRPMLVEGDAPVAAEETTGATVALLARSEEIDTDMSRFFPAPVAPVSRAPVAQSVRIDQGPMATPEATADRMLDGVAQSLEILDMAMDEDGLLDPRGGVESAPSVARPALALPESVAEAPRPVAPAPIIEAPQDEAVGEDVLGSDRIARHELRVDGLEVIPGQAANPLSIMDRDTRRVATDRNESMMIRLSYAADPDAVTQRVQELMRYFPQAMLDKGRFFGYAAPASPGLYIIGIQAHNGVDFQDLAAYMANNGIPHVLPGQSAAPLLTDPLASSQ